MKIFDLWKKFNFVVVKGLEWEKFNIQFIIRFNML